MNPFSYPKVPHERKFKPKQYKRYQTYKKILRLEFSGKCIYCQMPSSLKGSETFGVDHYRPQKFFPELSVAYKNLYYCCNSCNSAKGSYWPSTAIKELTEFIPNPCEHRMFDNLRYTGAVVDGKTAAGKIAVKLLDLNDPSAVDYREFVINSIEIAEEKQSKLLNMKVAVGQRLAKGLLSQSEASNALNELSVELVKVKNVIARFMGDPAIV